VRRKDDKERKQRGAGEQEQRAKKEKKTVEATAATAQSAKAAAECSIWPRNELPSVEAPHPVPNRSWILSGSERVNDPGLKQSPEAINTTTRSASALPGLFRTKFYACRIQVQTHTFERKRELILLLRPWLRTTLAWRLLPLQRQWPLRTPFWPRSLTRIFK
jgi:hypothetical protein